jgi:hypothetical protein
LFTSCYTLSFLPNISIHNATKEITNINNLRLEDTLAIITPFVKIYTTENIRIDDRIALIVSGRRIPNSCKRFPKAEGLLAEYFKSMYQKYFTVFTNKKELNISIEDSLIINTEMDKIKSKLSNELVTQLIMSDMLYNVLSKYHYKQFLITDISEFYEWVGMAQGSNIYSWYRFFIFDMNTKCLTYYNYNYDTGGASSGRIEKNDFIH